MQERDGEEANGGNAMKISYLAGMNVSASGLAAQREVMNTTAENLANAQTTRTESGDPYRRKVVALSEAPMSFTNALDAANPGQTKTETAVGVTATVEEDQSEFTELYDPGHPDADAKGMVRMPNVDTAREMVNLMVASRAYEANVAALQASRKLAEASLNLAR
jgi:flagellar basal-body rod protein FlgC